MRWATRRGCHVDRAGCAWLVRRFIDPRPSSCSSTTLTRSRPTPPLRHARCRALAPRGRLQLRDFLRRYALGDPALDEIGRIIQEADLADERFDAAEAAGLDVLIRGLSMTLDDPGVLEITGRLFDGLYAFKQRALTLGHEPA